MVGCAGPDDLGGASTDYGCTEGDDPTELRHIDSGYIHRMEFSRLYRGHFYADAIV